MRYSGSVATSVLPSPVLISAMRPECSTAPADQLHVVVPLADRAPRSLAHGGERLGQQVVERLAGQRAAAELGGLVAQRLVGQRLVLGLERVDLVDQRAGVFLISRSEASPPSLVQPVEHEWSVVRCQCGE